MRSSIAGRVNDAGSKEDTPSYQLDGSICSTNLEVLDMTLGMQELEDAVAEDQWCSSKAYENGTILHSVEIKEVTVKKSCMIFQKF